MITLIMVLAAFAWLLLETDWMRVRLPYGGTPRHKLKLAIAQWKVYDKAHSKEIAKDQKEYAVRQAHITAHTCPQCKASNDDIVVETKEARIGNSTCHIIGCPDCIDKTITKVNKSQTAKPRKPAYKPQASGFGHTYDSDGVIELLVDGKTVMATGNGSGEYKQGMIKTALKPYTTRMGKYLVSVGEADRVK